jgi:hypothetical protein
MEFFTRDEFNQDRLREVDPISFTLDKNVTLDRQTYRN